MSQLIESNTRLAFWLASRDAAAEARVGFRHGLHAPVARIAEVGESESWSLILNSLFSPAENSQSSRLL